MQEYLVSGHEPSVLPDGKFKLTWSDEFDGKELDRTKWDFRLHMMGTRWISWTDSEEALYLDGDSNCVFKLVNEDGTLRSAQLQTGYNFMDAPPVKRENVGLTNGFMDMPTWGIGKLRESKHLFRYGYFECRCRLQQKAGWWSAFWVQSPVIGASLDTKLTGAEIDVMESFSPGVVAAHNVFSGGYGVDNHRTKIGGMEGVDTSVFHRFGLLWEPDGYTFYVDGKEDGHVTADVSGIPEFLLISTEVYGYRKPGHAPYPASWEAVGDTFLVDYVRVFERDDA